MKIGVSTASLYPLETEKALQLLCENEVDCTEIFINSPSETDDEFINKLKRLKESCGIDVVSIHPCGSVCEPFFLFSDYYRRFLDYLEYYKRFYFAAQSLGAKYVVMHGDSAFGKLPMEEYCRRLMLLSEEAQKYGVTLTHENVNKFRASKPVFIDSINKNTGGKMKYTFDVKQSVRAGFTPDDIFDSMGEHIVNVHISDHNEFSDCLLPGRGAFDFSALFERLEHQNYDGACLIEVYNNAYTTESELFDAYKFVKKIHKNY